MTAARTAVLAYAGEIVTGSARVAELRPEWQRLWTDDPSADLFASFDWYANLCDTLGRAAGPATIVYHDGVDLAAVPGDEWLPRACIVRDASGVLVAVLPLVEVNGRVDGRMHRLLCTPINSQAPRSGIAATCFDEAVVAAMVAVLQAERGWTLLLLGGLPVGDGRARRLATALTGAGFASVADGSWPSSYLRFDRSLDDYFGGGERAHFRRSIVKATNGLAKLGAPSAECFGADRWRDGLEVFLRIDDASWKAQSGESVRSNPALMAYYAGLCDRLAKLSRLEIWILRVGDTPAAGFICPHDGRARYTLKSSFSAAFGAQHSPSLVLLHEMVRRTWASEASGIDFVGKVAFLERWATEDLAFHTSRYARSHAALRLIRASDAVHGLLARVRAASLRRLTGQRPPETRAATDSSHTEA